MASLSSHNPFRTPAVPPSPTGHSSTQQYAPPSGPPPRHPQQQQFAPPSTPHPPQQQYAPPPNPPPSNSSSSPPRTAQQQYTPPPNPPPSNPSPPTQSPDPTGLTEDELPPAYTTRPDVYRGESTLEYGPARPFQPVHQPPLPPLPPQPQSPVQSLWQQLTGQFTGSSTTQFPPAHWSSYPGGQQQQQQQYTPPANPPQQPQPPTTHMSEFARDFYATTTIPPGAFSDVSGARNNSSSDPGYPPPQQGTQQYQAPSGPPPPAPSPSRSPGAGGLPDDGRPTSTPVQGHPLLHNGNTLIYPPYHECHKCNNTGYKRGDPSRPCHRCWNRYARPYIAAGAAASSSFPQAQRQRPLPRLYSPFSPSSSSSGSYSSPSSLGVYPGATHGRTASASSLHGHTQYPPPSPQQTVYAPGDPRIGGTPCWRCDGRGAVSFLVFETVPCSVCRGVGRVFR